MSCEIEEDNNPYKNHVKEKIPNFMRDPLKFFGFSFLIFLIFTLIFYLTASPDFLKFGSFIIAVFMGIMCRQQMKSEMRGYRDR